MSARSVSATHLTRDLASWRDASSRPRAGFRSLAERISVLAQDGRLPVGVGLPGERDLATALQVSRTTVAAAYSLLREKGYLDSRQGARSTITLPVGVLSDATTGLHFGPASGDQGSGMIDLSYAAPPALSQVADAYREAFGSMPEHLAGHGLGVVGIARLRQAIADRYTARGLPTRPEQILVTSGAQHAMTLVVDLLISPGDRVLVDHPTYPHVIEAVTSLGGRVVPVALATEDGGTGWDLDGMRAAVRQLAPRMAYLIVDHHNPTGLSLDEDGRRAVATLGRNAHMTVVVDESLVELSLDGRPGRPMAGFGPVISIGSASKAFWGGLRIGWVRADEATITRLATLRAPRDLGTPPLEQLATALLLDRADELIPDRVAQLRAGRAALLGALSTELPQWRWVNGTGGLCVWAQMPLAVSSRLAALAPQFGLAVTAGPRFGVNGAFEQWLRLPFVHSPDRLRSAVVALAGVYRAVTVAGAPLTEPAVMV